MERYHLSAIRPEYYGSISSFREEIMNSGCDFEGCQKLDSYEDIEKWDLNCRLFEDPETVPPGYSPAFQYLYLDGDEVVGMINFRPLALEHVYLKSYGGHIGYSVRPSRRNEGIGSMMLKDMLKIARDQFGSSRILITCRKDNECSKRVIIKNGGVYESDIYYPPEESYLERYWIEL